VKISGLQWLASVGVGLLPLGAGIFLESSNQVHYIITDQRIIFIWMPLLLLLRKEQSYEFLDSMRSLIEANDHRYLLSAWFNEKLEGSIESVVPFFKIRYVKNVPLIVDHLALQFSRILDQQKWNVPHFRAKTRETAPVRGMTCIYVILLCLFFVGFLALSIATATLTGSLVVGEIFVVFGFIWIGFSAIAISMGLSKYIADKNKAAGRYFFIANNMEAPPVIPNVGPGADAILEL